MALDYSPNLKRTEICCKTLGGEGREEREMLSPTPTMAKKKLQGEGSAARSLFILKKMKKSHCGYMARMKLGVGIQKNNLESRFKGTKGARADEREKRRFFTEKRFENIPAKRHGGTAWKKRTVRNEIHGKRLGTEPIARP